MNLVLGEGLTLKWVLKVRISHSGTQRKLLKVYLQEVFSLPMCACVYSLLEKGATVYISIFFFF